MERHSHELVLTRRIAAPRSRVFEAWTDAEQFARWFGPAEYRTTDCTIDARPGGTIRFRMGPEEGPGYWHAGAFRDVVAPERIAFTLRFVDENGAPVPHPTLPEWPLETEFLQAVTLTQQRETTEMTLRQVVLPAEAARHPVFDIERPLARQGWAETLDRLDALLEGRSTT